MSAIFLTTKKNHGKRGVSILETILYTVLLTFVMFVVVQTLVATSGIYRNIKLTRELESSGTIAMESMLREIRNASSVVTGESTFNTNPGVLKISGVDASANPYNIVFNVSAGTIRISKNGDTPTALTSLSGTVSNLVFTRVASPNSEGVRIQLQMSGAVGTTTKSEKFYGFSVLRGTY